MAAWVAKFVWVKWMYIHCNVKKNCGVYYPYTFAQCTSCNQSVDDEYNFSPKNMYFLSTVLASNLIYSYYLKIYLNNILYGFNLIDQIIPLFQYFLSILYNYCLRFLKRLRFKFKYKVKIRVDIWNVARRKIVLK